MAAMDFPSSPTDGQVYGNYVYSTAKGAWQASPTPQSVAVSSPTAPSNPKNDTLWYNTQDGNTYIYFYDGNTSQWVQIKSDATLSSTLGNRVTTLETYPSGLVPVIPTSVTVGSGSSSTNANGLVTFTGASYVSLNGVFSSAYQRYKMVFSAANSSAGANFYYRWRSAGVDLSSANAYASGSYRMRSDSSTFIIAGNDNNAIACTGGSTTAASIAGEITITDVAVSGLRTYHIGQHSVAESNTLNYTMITGSHTAGTSAYDGISLLVNGGNLTGTIAVYGIR